MKNNIKKQYVLYIALLFTSFTFAQIPAYYNGFDLTKVGEDLKNDLAVLISNTHTTNLTYTPGVWEALQQTDLDPINSNNVLLIYGYNDTDNNYITDKSRSKDLNGGDQGTDWNREHTYPRSLGNPNLESTGPGSDAHHLRASDVTMNSNRGNLPYGAGSGNAGVVDGNWYPGDEWKGDVARMMMYMYLRYGTQCLPTVVGTGSQNYSADMMDVFLEWNQEDPVSQYEINRNVLLEGIQGNRNPFIDNPVFATTIWGGPQAEDRFNTTTIVDTEAPTVPTELSLNSTTATSTTLSWSAATDNVGVLAYQIFEGATQIASVTGTTYDVSGLTANTAYTFSVKAIDAASNVSIDNDAVTVTTLEETIIVSSSVIINEVDADTAGTDVLEFVELFDGGVGNTSLDGLVLVFYNGSNDLSYGAYDLDGQTTNVNGYFVIGNVDVPNVSSITFASNGLQNGADAVALYTGDATSFTSGTAVTTDNLVDAFVYDTNDADDTELLVLLNDEESQINEDEAGNKDGQSSQRFPNGSGGLRNTATYQQAIPTPGAANVGVVIMPEVNILINEVDADTAGTDVLEFVELYDGGVGNTSLDGLVLVMYNGSTDVSYGAYDLDGQTTDANGYFVIGNVDVANVSSITFASNGVQNGADAIALYTGDATSFTSGTAVTTDNLVDAFVYDTNDADDTELLVLLNDGESQINEDEAGDKDAQSSQRFPNGSGGVRNTSTYQQAIPTPGVANVGVVIMPEVNLMINEVDADTAGTDVLEFVELYDGGVGNTFLDGLVLVMYNGSTDVSYGAYDLDGQTTDANGYFVIGNVDVANVSSITFASNGVQNGADAIALYTGDATSFETGTAITTNNLVDAFVYDTNDADDAELLVLLNDGELQINEDEAGDKDGQSSQRFPNGTGGVRNTLSYVQAIPTPGAVNTNATEQINLIINEVDADTAGTDALEFVELYDGGVGNTALDGFVIVMYNGSNDLSYGVCDLAGQTTNDEGYFVLGNTDVANVNMILASNGLQNGADAVALYTGVATAFSSGTAITTDGLIDALVYDTDDADDAELLVLINEGQLQINEAELGDKDGHSLQRIPNGDGGARNTETYIQATPSPGTENGAIIEAPDVISIAEARALDSGELVTVEGVLTVSDQFLGSAYIQDSTGGIAIFDELVHGDDNFMIGDSITVTGTRSLFNEQIQISTVTAVTNNGLPNNPIEPLTITLSQLGDHPAELVRIIDPAFPAPGEILFGNSNYELTDASGTGELRISNNVSSIVGLGQPETCSEVIGVVGKFYEIYQLLPRLREDLSCGSEYTAPDTVVQLDKEKALDIVTWNIEWFGDESNSPAAGNDNSDLIQKDSVKTVINTLNADIYAVQEIADATLFTEMVSELPGYDFVLSDATSYPNDTEGTKQQIGFIYNTETVEVVETKVLLEAIHPYYNGGDESALTDFPDDDKTRFYASGRLPFMLTANVTIDGITEQVNLVNLHARANSSSGPQERYDMRKYDVEVLKDSLDTHYANSKLILLGDYNDDVDFTVADDVTSTVSTYEAYVNDAENYNIVSSTLSDQGYRSYAFRENMIDHIMLSDELFENYVASSAQVHYEFYDSDYTTTSSDHFAVSVQIQLLDNTWIGATDSDWNTATNWLKGNVPNSTDNVVIPSDVLNYPTISSGTQVNISTVTINSGATVLIENEGSITGQVTYNKDINSDWHLIASPFSDETIEDVVSNHTLATGTGDNMGLGLYNNNTSQAWNYQNVNSRGNLDKGKGYAIKLASAGALTLTGNNILSETLTVNVTSGNESGFNLIGNPYLANYEIKDFLLSGDTDTLSERTAWIWDGSQYITHNLTSSYVISPLEGFFVEAAIDGMVSFSPSNLKHSHSILERDQLTNTNLELLVSSGEKEASTEVFFIEGKTEGFDNGYDSSIFEGANIEFNFFTGLISDPSSKKLAIQTLSYEGVESQTIPLGLVAEVGEEIVFSIKTNNLEEGVSVYLEDKLTGVFTNLNENNYETTLENDVNGIGQFYIHTSLKSLSIDEVITAQKLNVYKSSAHQLIVLGNKGQTEVKIFNVLGKEILSTILNENDLNIIELTNLIEGVYIVKATSELTSITKKIILN